MWLLISETNKTHKQAFVIIFIIAVATICIAAQSSATLLAGVSNPVPSLPSPSVLNFVPQGVAIVELNDGSNFSVPANCFMYMDSSTMNNGLLTNNNDETILFDTMKSFMVENSSIIVTLQDN